MGTDLHGSSIAALGNSTIKLSAGWNAFWFWGVWVVCIIGIGIVLWAALRSKRWDRWTTQDILIVAALGVRAGGLRQHHRRPVPQADHRRDPRRGPAPGA